MAANVTAALAGGGAGTGGPGGGGSGLGTGAGGGTIMAGGPGWYPPSVSLHPCFPAGGPQWLTGNGQQHAVRSLDRALEEAASSGILNLSGRKLRDFPGTGYDLTDTTQAGIENGLEEVILEELQNDLSW